MNTDSVSITWYTDGVTRGEFGPAITHAMLGGETFSVVSKGNSPNMALMKCASLPKDAKKLGSSCVPEGKYELIRKTI